MKFIVLILVVGIVLLLMFKPRRRGPDQPAAPRRPGADKAAKDAKPAPMLACAHCGVHLPKSETTTDADGRAYCSEAHRLAGPR